MKLSAKLATHLNEVYFGGNWTASNLKQSLSDVTWKEATTQVYDLNTIATIAHHINYYIEAVSKVLEGEPLNAKDELSFIYAPIENENNWTNFLKRCWANAEKFTSLIKTIPEDKLWLDFEDKKYGDYFRNILGIIEHNHYHLGQIVVIKKILRYPNQG
tara:strand:+ start:50644 stop:51120 length:477 start_codon:yes stop_codon:yes gene_type:complete